MGHVVAVAGGDDCEVDHGGRRVVEAQREVDLCRQLHDVLVHPHTRLHAALAQWLHFNGDAESVQGLVRVFAGG